MPGKDSSSVTDARLMFMDPLDRDVLEDLTELEKLEELEEVVGPNLEVLALTGGSR